MDVVTIRELCNNGGEVIDRVAAGRPATITRDGRPVAELVPLRRSALDAETLVARWRHVPRLDGSSLRADLDTVMDQTL